MKRIFICCVIALLTMASAGSGETINVPDDYPAIQLAISNASDGDVIVVQPGTYVENINFLGKNITVTGTNPYDLEAIEDTVIDGDEDGSVVMFINGETNAAVLTGVTITSGFGTMNEMFGEGLFWGAGIYMENSSPTITRNLIIGNEGPLEVAGGMEMVCYGGGIGGIESSAVISNNIIRNNAAYAGAGLMTYMGNPVIKNNFIHDNSAFIAGGVVLFGGRLINNTISDNNLDLAAAFGEEGMAGNVYVARETGMEPSLVSGNIISGAPDGGGILYIGLSEEEIRHNDVWANVPGNYYGIDPMTGQEMFDGPADLTGKAGNISEDPLFANNFARDYHILEGSPCISAGDRSYQAEPDETDFDGDPRVYAVIVDIGADEFVGYVRPVADAGPDRHLLDPQVVTLDGTNSFFWDPCDDTEYSWEQLEGPLVELTGYDTATPSFEAFENGLYSFELVVSDGTSFSNPDEVVIQIGNELPVADAGPNQVTSVPGMVQLDGSGSYDPDVLDQLQYSWTQVAGPEVVLERGDTASPSFFCEQAGLYAFELVVSDPFVSSPASRVEVKTVAISVEDYTFDPGIGMNYYQFHPAISGNTIVCTMGDFWDSEWDITYKDMTAPDVVTLSSPGIDVHPDIDARTIVWSGGATVPYTGYQGPVNLSIFAYDIATQQQVTLAEHTPTRSFAHPAISGDIAVWLEFPDAYVDNEALWGQGIYNIVGADISDLSNPRQFFISEEAGERDPYNYSMAAYDMQNVLDISGNIVVWEGYGDIFGADISDINNIRYFTICDEASMQRSPVISGSIVVWVDQRNDSGDLYAADISDINDIDVFPIARGVMEQTQPAIDGRMVSYVTGNMYGGTIMLVALAHDNSAVSVPLSTYSYGAGPVISGDSVVWQDAGYGYLHGMKVIFAYSAAGGPVHNTTTGLDYDFVSHAVNQASPADIIVVEPGHYQENVVIKGAPIQIRSIDPNDPAIVASTIIDGQSRAPVMTFNSVNSAGCIIDGLTITNGSAGIYANASRPTILNSRIVANDGPGVKLEKESHPVFRRCLVAHNNAAGFEMPKETGGRFILYNKPEITNCVIAFNAKQGLWDSNPKITNCTIAYNGLAGIDCSWPVVTNSIIYGNGMIDSGIQIVHRFEVVSYCDVMGGYEGPGNIDYDPMFADPCNGDFHLMSKQGRWDPDSMSWVVDAQSSPCIDAGDPNSSPGEEPDPNGQTVNLGAYGATWQASMTFDAGCFPADDPAYDEWVQLGRPDCWCYPAQCHGDADGLLEGNDKQGYYRVHFEDLNTLIAAWNIVEPPQGAGIAGVVAFNGVPAVCADFSHSAEGSDKTGFYRVHFCDLGRLVAGWHIKEPPLGPGTPADCGGTLEP